MVRNKGRVQSMQGPENYGMKFRLYSMSAITEMQNVIIMTTKCKLHFKQAPHFVLHAVDIHESVLPLEAFKDTVTTKKREIH